MQDEEQCRAVVFCWQKEADSHTYSVEIRLSAQEKEMLDEYMAAHNMDVYGHALRYFMQKIIGDWKASRTNEEF